MINDDKLANIENLLEFVPYPPDLYKVSTEEYSKSLLQYTANKLTILPELAAVIPFDILLKFLFVFAGQQISIPEQKLIINSIRDLDIFFSLRANSSSIEINRLSEKYELTTQAVRVIVEKVSEALHQSKIELKS